MSDKLAVFDLDGTLMDTSEGILEAVKYAVKTNGLPMPPDETIVSFIGPPIETSLTANCAPDPVKLAATAASFRQYYAERSLFKAKPYEGIFSLLKRLQNNGFGTAIATNKRDSYATELLQKFGFDKIVPIIHGTDDKGLLKKKDLINLCIKEYGHPQVVWMIGDASSDRNAAEAAGVNFLGVTYGFSYKKGEKYDFPTADSPEEIFDILTKSGNLNHES